MRYSKIIYLKDGRECLIKSAGEDDAEAMCTSFSDTHSETDFLLTYPDESSFTPDEERKFLIDKENSDREIELCAVVDGRIVGSAGVDALSQKCKLQHRAEFGISILRSFWGLGIGRALTECSIEMARKAGYEQLELEVVSDNSRAIALYESEGFIEYGRNPRGFKSRESGYQCLVLMRLEL